jgi:hypothetical protein
MKNYFRGLSTGKSLGNAGIDGYCCTSSHTHTHTRTHTLDSTPLDEWSAFYFQSTQQTQETKIMLPAEGGGGLLFFAWSLVSLPVSWSHCTTPCVYFTSSTLVSLCWLSCILPCVCTYNTQHKHPWPAGIFFSTFVLYSDVFLLPFVLVVNTFNTNIHAPGGIRTRKPRKR